MFTLQRCSFRPFLLVLMTFIVVIGGQENLHSQGHKGAIVLSEWIGQERVEISAPLILLDFWATWCGPCHAVQPHLSQLQDRSRGKMQVVQISQQPYFTVEEFLKKKPASHPVAIDADKKTHIIYGVNSLPYAVLLDYQGTVLWHGSPADLKFAELDRLIRPYQIGKSAENLIRIEKSAATVSRQPTNYTSNPALGGVSYTETSIQGQPMGQDSQFYYLFGTVNNIVLQLGSQLDLDVHYRTECETSGKYWELHLPKDQVESGLQWFLDREGYQISTDTIQEEYIYITGLNPSRLWSAEVLDYGPGLFIASEYGVEIDNVPLSRMCAIVSESSDFRVDCSEVNYTELHDWNIYYKDLEGLLTQFRDELGFTFHRQTVTHPAHIIRCQP